MARVLNDATYYGIVQDEEDQYEDTPQVARSFSAGVKGLEASAQNVLAAGGRVLGADEFAATREAAADKAAAEAQGIRGAAVKPFTDVESVEEGATAVTDALASNVPLVGAQLTGAAGGAAIGSAFGPVGTIAGGLIGGAIPYYGTVVGENYGSLRHDPEAEGTRQEQALGSFAAGVPQTAIGMVAPTRVASMLGRTAPRGMASSLAVTAGLEGATEAGESAIGRFTHSQFNPNVNLFDAEARRDYLNSFLAGAVVGGGYGLAGEGLNRAFPPPKERPQVDDMFTEEDDLGGALASIEEDALGVQALLDAGDISESEALARIDVLRAEADVLRSSNGDVYILNKGRQTLEGEDFSRASEVPLEAEPPRLQPDYLRRLSGEPYIYDPSNNRTGVSRRDLDILRAADPNFTYEEVGLRQQNEAEGLNPVEAAEELVRRNPSYEAFYDRGARNETAVSAAEKFLSRFRVIRKTPKTVDALASITDLDVHVRDLFGGEYPSLTLKKPSAKDNRFWPITIGGHQAWINVPNMTSRMLNEVDRAGNLPQNADTRTRIEAAAQLGLATVASMPGVQMDLKGQDPVVAFANKKAIRFSQLKNTSNVRGLTAAELRERRESEEDLNPEAPPGFRGGLNPADDELMHGDISNIPPVDILSTAPTRKPSNLPPGKAPKVTNLAEAEPRNRDDNLSLGGDPIAADTTKRTEASAPAARRERRNRIKATMQLAGYDRKTIDATLARLDARTAEALSRTRGREDDPANIGPALTTAELSAQNAANTEQESDDAIEVNTTQTPVDRADRTPEVQLTKAENEELVRRIRQADRRAQRAQERIKLSNLIQEMGKRLDLKLVRMLSMEEALVLMEERGDTVRAQRIRDGKQKGFYDRKTGAIFVHPSLHGAYAVATAMHELGHAVLHQKFERLPTEQKAEVTQAFEKWLGEQKGHTQAQVRRSKQSVAHLVERYLRDRHAISDLSPGQRAVLTSFNEWFADNVARWSETSEKPRSIVEKFFDDVAKAIKVLISRFNERFGKNVYAADASVAAFMDSLMVSSAFETLHLHRETERQQPPPPTGPPTDGAPPPPPPDGPEGPPPGGEFMGMLHEWYNAFRAGGSAVLSKDMVDAISQHIHDHMSRAEFDVLVRAAQSDTVRSAMFKVVGGDPAAVEDIYDGPVRAAAYLFALKRLDLIDTGPKTTKIINKAIEQINEFYQDAFGEMTEEAQMDALLNGIARGWVEREGRNDFVTLPANVVQEHRRQVARAWKDKVLGWKAKLYDPIMNLPYERLRDLDNPMLEWISEQLVTPATAQGRRESFLEAKSRMVADFDTKYLKILGDRAKDKVFKLRIAELMNNPQKQNNATAEEKVVIGKIHKLFDEIYNYAEQAGLKFGKRSEGRYFPWIFNHQYLHNNMNRLYQLASQDKYKGEWAAMRQRWIDAERVSPNVTHEDFILARLSSLLKPEGVQSGTTADGTHNPGFRFMNPRDLNFLRALGNEQDNNTLSEFFHPDLDVIMTSYFRSAVKRTEYTRRFGAKGEKLIAALEKARVDWGATDEEIKLAMDTVDATLGMYGTDTRVWLERQFEQSDLPESIKSHFVGQHNGVINEKLQRKLGWIITYQNYRLLVLSAFMSFTDPFTLTARNGSPVETVQAIREAMKAVWDASKGNPNVLNDLVDTVNTIDHVNLMEEISAEYNGNQPYTPWQQKFNDVLFKYNQVENITQFSRRVATIGASKAIQRWVRDGESRKLEELGLREGDVQVENGQLRFLSDQERKRATKAERERDDRVKHAVRRFVDTTNLRPHAGNRPLWMNDPHWVLVGHLKAFPFVFHENIIKRLGREAMHGDLRTLVMVGATFMMITMFADWLRDMVKYVDPEGAPWKRDWTFEQHLAYTAKRAGLFGRDEITADVLAPMFEGDPVQALTEALGPTATQIRQVMSYGLSERDLPGQVLYRHWD